MGFLDSIKSMFGGGAGEDATGYFVYVRCDRCGEALKTRIDMRNDLSRREEGGFIVRKVLVGSQRCFERIEVSLTFDENRKLIEREIARGEFITPEEFAEDDNN
jgi:hypothetical protein